MKTKVYWLFLCMGLFVGMVFCTSCNENSVTPDPDKTGDSYGVLNGNLIATGDAKEISYVSAVLLGVVDFAKLEASHTYGVVYIEEQDDKEYNYDVELNKGNGNILQVTSSTVDGKFEKKITGLKPATKYYYRTYLAIGSNYNYSAVKSFTSQDPSSELFLNTAAATDITALSATLNGSVNIDQLPIDKSGQNQGFICSSTYSSPETLSFEYYNTWRKNHPETEATHKRPWELLTTGNLNKKSILGLEPGKTYYYRTFFSWNGKYFYSKDVGSFTTEDANTLDIRTEDATAVSPTNATLHASFLFEKIGKSSVEAGFIYSDVYSTSSELTKNKLVNYTTKIVNADNYSVTLNNLKPATKYYYRAYVAIPVIITCNECYGNYENGYTYIYSSIKNFTTSEIETSGFVDLGLSSGTMWAACNLGADSPEQEGTKYTWADAEAALGDGEAFPSREDLYELRDCCTWTSCSYNGAAGSAIIGKTGKAIFIPRYTSKGYDEHFWTSDAYTATSDEYAYYFYLSSYGFTLDYRTKGEMLYVRRVKK